MSSWPPELAAALASLRSGCVVAAPTESSFGLLATLAPAALDELFRAKPRGNEKGIPLLLPDERAWGTVAREPPAAARRLAALWWPGRLSIAIPALPTLDPRVTLEGTVAARVPGPSVAATLVRALGQPLTATSANAPGEPAALEASEVRAAFPAAAASGRLLVIDARAPGGPPSTLVVVDGEGARIARDGAVPGDSVLRALLDGPRRER